MKADIERWVEGLEAATQKHDLPVMTDAQTEEWSERKFELFACLRRHATP